MIHEDCEHYDPFDFPMPENLPLPALLLVIEYEVSVIAAINEDYSTVWQLLTPDTALEFVLRRCPYLDDEEYWWVDHTEYENAISSFLAARRTAAQAVQQLVDATRAHDPLEIVEGWQASAVVLRSNLQGTIAPELLEESRRAFDRMSVTALYARLGKLTAPTKTREYWARDTSSAIDQIRSSRYKDDTLYLLHRDVVPPSLLQFLPTWRCLALSVSDEWLFRCGDFLNLESPKVAIAHRPGRDGFPILELASGTIRLPAHALLPHLFEFDAALRVLFVGTGRCCLTFFSFRSLVDGALLENTLHELDGQQDEVPSRNNAFTCLPDGTMVGVQERLRLFDAWMSDCPLTADPDEADQEIPF
ncbi:hypothetical protein QF001_001764 [Paraburkholderia youngii]|uniref:hypothetical protein n=1 Tax=Paraburkholderia youngii TaxID=2782701 RepID=UPI003D244739